MAMSVARLKKDEIQRLKKAIDSLRCPTVELHESETSATAEEPPRRERKNGDIPRDERNNTTITIAVVIQTLTLLTLTLSLLCSSFLVGSPSTASSRSSRILPPASLTFSSFPKMEEALLRLWSCCWRHTF
ncbi:hypothetical protein GLYMA_03G041950v4 [Glycine max]|nr:hypothetical protein GLYMA_03G041950v4 [Glycine max]